MTFPHTQISVCLSLSNFSRLSYMRVVAMTSPSPSVHQCVFPKNQGLILCNQTTVIKIGNFIR